MENERPGKKAYSYAYDGLNRLIKADYSGTALVGGRPVYHAGDVDRGDYSVSGIGYDLNGNLTGMNQKGQVQNAGHLFDDIDQLKYLYKPSSNQLDHVEDYTSFTSANSNPDFRDNHTGASDYEWDANGNMTIDRNKDITTPINYTYGNKPLTINIANGQIMYTYDAFGNKLKKTVTGPNGTDTWAYIGPCVYKNGTLEMVLHPEGRAMPKPGGAVTDFNYDYFMKDHLGNVRSVVRTYAYNKLSDLQVAEIVNGGGSGVTPPADPGGSGTTGPGGMGGMVTSPADPNAPITEYVASMEIASAQTEGLLWDNISTVRDTKPGSTDPADTKAASLYGNEADKRIGTAIMLRVMPGDRFSLSGQSNYDTDQPEALAYGVNGQVLANALLSALTKGTVNGSTPVSEVPDNLKLVQEAFMGDQFGQAVDLLQGQVQDPQRPASHLNYVVMNDQMQVLNEQSGALQIKGAGVWAEVSKEGDIVIEQPGYLTVFTSSRAPDVMRWDVIRLTEYRGNSVEENFYYPFGLTLSTVGPNPAEKNNIKLTTKELQGDLGLNWYDFGARMQDMQIGRWLQHDPLAEKIPGMTPYNYVRNNPVSRIDINGMSDGDFIDENGKYLGNDGINDGKVYVMKTTQKSFGRDDVIPGAGIDPKTIKGAKQFIKENSGNMAAFQNDRTAYNNSIEIPGAESTRAGMVNAMSGDNGKGGEAPSNNREYSVTADGSGNTTALSPGPVGDPKTASHLEGVNWDPTNVLYFGHSHASGNTTVYPPRNPNQTFNSSEGMLYNWSQPPSSYDVQNANNRTEFTFGMGSKTIYIYTNQGVQATLPLDRFIKFKR